VIGTAIGAAIGGVVTVASLIVKGRQDAAAEQRRNDREDHQRREDHALAVRERDHDKRQSLYRQINVEANQARLAAIIASLTARIDTSDEEEIERALASDRVGQFWTRFSSDGDMIAYSEEVIEAATEVVQALNGALNTIRSEPHAKGSITNEPHDSALNASNRAMGQLRDACRRDLGYDTAPPPSATT
jgi:hypothetical protein